MKQLATIVLILLGPVVLAQHGLAFYHLKNATYQNSNYNPAFMPHGTFFLGLPGISGVNVYVNNRFSYNDIIKKNQEDSSSTFVDIGGTIKKLGFQNNVSAHTTISLLHIGIRLPSEAVVSLFANERLASDVVYPKEIMDWGWRGNAYYLGEKVKFNSLGVSLNYFREIGLGLQYAPKGSPLKVGVRAKYLMGIMNMSTPTRFKGKVVTDRVNYNLNVESKRGVLRSSGVDTYLMGLLDGNVDESISHLISNGNFGLGIDAGFEYTLNRYYSFAASITDLGFISWKEDVLNTVLRDTTFRYSGIELDGADNLLDGLDTLKASFNFDTTFDNYTAMIPANIIGSFTYTPYKGTDIITTVNARIIQNQIKTGLGVGIRHFFGPKLVVSATATRLPQQFVNVGAALSATAGVVQFYVAADKLFGYNVPEMRWAEFRVGLNLVFGSGSKDKGSTYSDSYKQYDKALTEPKGVVTGTFQGRKVKVKGNDGIYTDVVIDDPGPAGTITPKVINDSKPKMGIISDSRGEESKPKRSVTPASATGQTQTNTGRKVQPQSASGQTPTNSGRKVRPQSATGQTPTNDGRKVRPQSASGQSQGKSVKRSTNRSPSGGTNTASKMSNRNVRRSAPSSQRAVKKQKAAVRSASGGGRPSSKKKTSVRSASGGQKSTKKKKSSVRSATGKQKHQKGKRKKN